MTSPNIRTATSADLDKFYGDGRPRESVRAIVVDLDNDIVGIAGLAYHKGQMIAFSVMRDEMRKYPVTIMKAARKFAKILDKHGRNVLAVASDTERNSDNFLLRVGFEFLDDTNEGRIYKWQQRYPS